MNLNNDQINFLVNLDSIGNTYNHFIIGSHEIKNKKELICNFKETLDKLEKEPVVKKCL